MCNIAADFDDGGYIGFDQAELGRNGAWLPQAG